MNGFGGIGGWELLLVAVIAMLVLGPEHMVKHAYRFGRWVRKLSVYWREGTTAFREQLKDLEEEAVGDSADLPNFAELKDLAAEIRLEDELRGISSTRAVLDEATRSQPETGIAANASPESTSPDDAKAVEKKPMSYSAWRPPRKSTK